MNKAIDIDVFLDCLSNFLRNNPSVTLNDIKNKFLPLYGNVKFNKLVNLEQTKNILSCYGL